MFRFIIVLLTIAGPIAGRMLARNAEQEEQEAAITCSVDDATRLDDNLKKIATFSDADRAYPSNMEELTPHCRENRYMVNWNQNYTRQCLRETSKHVTHLAMHAIKALVKKYCFSGQKTKDAYMSWARCGNAAKPQTVKCWTDYIRLMQSVEHSRNDRHKIPLMCCLHHQFAACNLVAKEDLGSNVCPPKSVDGLQDLLNRAMFDVIKYLCGEYETDDNDRCSSMMRNLPKVEFKGRLPPSPLTTLIKVLDSLPPQ